VWIAQTRSARHPDQLVDEKQRDSNSFSKMSSNPSHWGPRRRSRSTSDPRGTRATGRPRASALTAGNRDGCAALAGIDDQLVAIETAARTPKTLEREQRRAQVVGPHTGRSWTAPPVHGGEPDDEPISI